MERGQICTQLRLPSGFHAEVSAIAKRDGLSLNTAILMLMRLGMKLYESDIVITAHPHQNTTVQHVNAGAAF